MRTYEQEVQYRVSRRKRARVCCVNNAASGRWGYRRDRLATDWKIRTDAAIAASC